MKNSVKSKTKVTPAQKLKVISARLRKGDFTSISKKTGYDVSHVSRVLRGIRSNPSGEIISTAYTMVSKRKVK